MANKIVKRTELLHYNSEYDVCPSPGIPISSPIDKSKSISDFDDEGLNKLIYRLRNEKEAEDIIRSLRRSAGEKDTYENPLSVDTTTPVNQLYHFGILGMKWGRRRFQNKDGSRTAAGKKREMDPELKELIKMEKESDKAKVPTVKSDLAIAEDYRKSREDKAKSPEGLSNLELRSLNERLQLEATYKALTAEKIQKSESFVKSVLQNAGKSSMTTFTSAVFLGAAKTLVKQVSPTFYQASFGNK